MENERLNKAILGWAETSVADNNARKQAEAQLAEAKEKLQYWHKHNDELVDKLAVLKARRCRECAYKTDARVGRHCYIYDDACYEDDFACNRWTERGREC